jgi:hypothetical protein
VVNNDSSGRWPNWIDLTISSVLTNDSDVSFSTTTGIVLWLGLIAKVLAQHRLLALEYTLTSNLKKLLSTLFFYFFQDNSNKEGKMKNCIAS